MTREQRIAALLELGGLGKYLAMWDAWSELALWLETGEVEDGDLVLDRMHELEDEVINPVTHSIRTVELPPLDETS